jgi:hypothetical protein
MEQGEHRVCNLAGQTPANPGFIETFEHSGRNVRICAETGILTARQGEGLELSRARLPQQWLKTAGQLAFLIHQFAITTLEVDLSCTASAQKITGRRIRVGR